ncbi:MAG: HEAT repeat domain-containing protein [bacterium]
MRFARHTMAALGLLAAALAAAGEPDYAAMLRNHESRMELLEQGVQALPPLLDIAVSKDTGLAAEARRMVRWLAVRATDSPDQRAAMTKALVATADQAESVEVRKLAVAALALCGRDEAVPLLVAMVETPELGEAAADALAQLLGHAATKALMVAFSKAKGQPRLLLGEALAARRDPAAVAVVVTMLDDEGLREEAVESLVRTPGAAAAKELAAAIDEDEPAFRARVLRALGRRRSPQVLSPALKYASEKHDVERVAALEALGRLADPSATAVVLEATKSDDAAVQAAALTAYRRLADPLIPRKPDQAAEMLVYVLERVDRAAERIAALGGLRRARQPDAMPAVAPLLTGHDWRVGLSAAKALAAIPGDAATEAMRKALNKATPAVRAALLHALGEREAASAVPDIVSVAADAGQDVQIAAMAALAAIASPEAEPAIREALSAEAPAVRTAAAQALVALGRRALSEDDRKAALARFHRVLAADVGPDAAVPALEGVARLAAAESASLVEPFLQDSGPLRDAAARAYMAIASGIAAGGEREEAVPMLERVVTLKPPVSCAGEAALRLRALGGKVEIPARRGVVSHWWLLGAWPAERKDWGKAHFPEKKDVDLVKAHPVDGRKLRWKAHHTDDPQGMVTLDELLQPNDAAVAYAYTEIKVDQEQDATIEVASDDGCIVWLNGAKVYEHLETRSWGSPPDRAKAHLSAGVNTLLVKACEGTGTWAFRVRLLDGRGKPLAFTMR